MASQTEKDAATHRHTQTILLALMAEAVGHLFPDTDRREAYVGQLNAVMAGHDRELEENVAKSKKAEAATSAKTSSSAPHKAAVVDGNARVAALRDAR